METEPSSFFPIKSDPKVEEVALTSPSGMIAYPSFVLAATLEPLEIIQVSESTGMIDP
jgi:hypothetical protein